MRTKRAALSAGVIGALTGLVLLISGTGVQAQTAQSTAVQAAAAQPAAAQLAAPPDQAARCAWLTARSTWVHHLADREAADANTWGSTAWLVAKQATATAAGKTELAQTFQHRIDNRAAHPDRLTTLAAKLDERMQKVCS